MKEKRKNAHACIKKMHWENMHACSRKRHYKRQDNYDL